MPSRLDLTGKRFYNLVAIKFGYIKKNITYWLWKCDCGNEKYINLQSVTRGITKSCGCLKESKKKSILSKKLSKKEYDRQYYLKNKIKILNRNSEYNKLNKDKVKLSQKRYDYKKRYGITLQRYKEMCELQNNKCLGYNKITVLVVDHNHKTGKVRGLLCQECNKVLGFAQDNFKVLENLSNYLIGRNG